MKKEIEALHNCRETLSALVKINDANETINKSTWLLAEREVKKADRLTGKNCWKIK